MPPWTGHCSTCTALGCHGGGTRQTPAWPARGPGGRARWC
ncbi:CxxxxCH/CxxCH domain-containing protein [Streptomyces sp. NPDC047070]